MQCKEKLCSHGYLCKQSEIKLSGDGAGILSNFSIGNYKDTQIDAE